jgi:hypothetical protein
MWYLKMVSLQRKLSHPITNGLQMVVFKFIMVTISQSAFTFNNGCLDGFLIFY